MSTHIDKRRVPRPTVKECLFLLSKTQCKTYGSRLSSQEETNGKRGKSLTLTIGGSESTVKDRVTDDLSVGLKTASVEPELHLSRGTVVEVDKIENN